MTFMQPPNLHESFSQSSNRNLESHLPSLHSWPLASRWSFPLGPAWKNYKVKLIAQRESLLLEELQVVFAHQLQVCKAYTPVQSYQPEVPSPGP